MVRRRADRRAPAAVSGRCLLACRFRPAGQGDGPGDCRGRDDPRPPGRQRPMTPAGLARATGLGEPGVALALARLETEGFALRGRFTGPDGPGPAGPEEFCARRVLARIHAYTRQRKRSEVSPVPPR